LVLKISESYELRISGHRKNVRVFDMEPTSALRGIGPVGSEMPVRANPP